jgi:hypothetical protein
LKKQLERWTLAPEQEQQQQAPLMMKTKHNATDRHRFPWLCTVSCHRQWTKWKCGARASARAHLHRRLRRSGIRHHGRVALAAVAVVFVVGFLLLHCQRRQ